AEFSGPGMRPSALYGYCERYPVGTATCSTVHSDSMPASSQLFPREAASSGCTNGPTLANATPNFMAILLSDGGAMIHARRSAIRMAGCALWGFPRHATPTRRAEKR